MKSSWASITRGSSRANRSPWEGPRAGETPRRAAGVFILREAAKVLGIDLNGKTMAIQGFGNAGQFAALLGHEILGLKLVAASDSKGGIYNPKGLDARQVVDYKLKTGVLQGFPEADSISNEDLLEMDVTVLFPSALENVITNTNAEKIKCRISCELANGPTTPEADEILHHNNVFVLPDFLANAGGVHSLLLRAGAEHLQLLLVPCLSERAPR